MDGHRAYNCNVLRCHRSNIAVNALFALVISFAWGSAEADPMGALLQLEIKDGSVGDPSIYDPAAISVSNSLSFGGGSASGYANLMTGILKAGATAPARGNSYDLFYGFSRASIMDDVTFGPTASGVGYLDFHWDGTLPAFDNMLSSTGGLSIYIAAPGGVVTDPSFILDNHTCDPYTLPSGSICTAGTSIDQTVSVPFVISPGTTFFQLSLLAYPTDGGTANFLDTASFALRLPGDVTYTSASGEFLASATPIVGGQTVSEPMMLFPLGLSFLVAARHRRRRSNNEV